MRIGVIEYIAYSYSINYLYQQLLLLIVLNCPNMSKVIIISNNNIDKSRPNKFNLKLEQSDYLSAINSDNKINYQGGK